MTNAELDDLLRWALANRRTHVSVPVDILVALRDKLAALEKEVSVLRAVLENC